jgi:hypothetical protein
MTEAGIDSNDQRATTRREIMRMLDASYAEILKEKKVLVSLDFSA